MPVITEVCGLDELRALWPGQPFRFGAGPRQFFNLLVLMRSQAPPSETGEDVIEWHPRRDGQSGQRPRAQNARRAPRGTATYYPSFAGLL